jgi:hypothetical protein
MRMTRCVDSRAHLYNRMTTMGQTTRTARLSERYVAVSDTIL